MKKILFLFASTTIFISACTTNAVTGRKQLSLISEGALQQEAVAQYSTFLNQNKVVTNGGSRDAEMVRRVGSRIATAITQYYNSQGKGDVLQGYKWEFNLVDNKQVNAWCMPGGKVVVYTGLFTVALNEAQLGIVLGHEITHAVASHGQERISQAMLAQGLGVVGSNVFGSSQAGNVFNNVYGPAVSVGALLPNSRNQELEADRFGLRFAAMAGYNPQEAIPFWTRMANMGGAKPPPFLSTHPADAQRIQRLKSYMGEAMTYYKPMNNR
ncbi:MAG: M48 family metallopeptidase [Chitinophagaceae bacterium]|nr:M48 family metallopeptidase [Chitinophagaceae bacterium]